MAWLTGVRRSIHLFSRRVSWVTVTNCASSRCRSSSFLEASLRSNGSGAARETHFTLSAFSSTCMHPKFCCCWARAARGLLVRRTPVMGTVLVWNLLSDSYEKAWYP